MQLIYPQAVDFLFIIENIQIYESINRTFWKESRHSTYDWIDALIDRSINIGNQYSVWKDIITKSVLELKQPIEILKQTYNGDPDMVSKFSNLLLRIKLPLYNEDKTKPVSIKQLPENKNEHKSQSYLTAIDDKDTWPAE